MKDEFHFLLECSLYHELRITYIKPYYWKNIDYAKLMCNEGRWFVDMSLYVCIMNVYMFDYWLHTQRHVCQRYSVINSWNSCILNWWLTIIRAWTLSLLRYMVKDNQHTGRDTLQNNIYKNTNTKCAFNHTTTSICYL